MQDYPRRGSDPFWIAILLNAVFVAICCAGIALSVSHEKQKRAEHETVQLSAHILKHQGVHT